MSNNIFTLTFRSMDDTLRAAKHWISQGNYSIISKNDDGSYTLTIEKIDS